MQAGWLAGWDDSGTTGVPRAVPGLRAVSGFGVPKMGATRAWGEQFGVGVVLSYSKGAGCRLQVGLAELSGLLQLE